jgi:CRISPR/Cas system-associated endonuclease Cas1
MFNFMQLAETQSCMRFMSDCRRMQLTAEFIARKILRSSANNKKLEYSIAVHRSLMNILKSNRLRTDP